MKKLEIYIHIPFCMRKCQYCDFLSFPADQEARVAYVDALCREIERAEIGVTGTKMLAPEQEGRVKGKFSADDHASEGDEGKKGYAGKAFNNEGWIVSALFFGGGTPSVLQAEDIGRIMDKLHERFIFTGDAEISIETNPGTIDEEKLKAYRSVGINRISMGCQSMDDQELARLGRIHRRDDFLRSFTLARQSGFENINVDLMSALPGQSPADWERNLRAVAELGPEHISAYSLIIEDGTPFARLYDKGLLDLPSEEEERQMYQETSSILSEYGYHQYEISNYARDGFECRHNLGYWTGVDYLAFGLGASSYINGIRFRNTADMEKYMSCYGQADMKIREEMKIREDIEILTPEDMQSEFMILGLRLNRGVSAAEFQRRFGQPIMEVYGQVIHKYLDLGLLQKMEGKDDFRIALTERGFSLSNQVMADMLQ